MITMEITAAIDAAGTLRTFYLGTDDFVTGPTDTPPHTAFMSRLVNPASLSIHAYADSATSGSSKLESGETVIANADGALDGWLDYGFDGQPVVIRYSTDGAGAYPAAWSVVFQGVGESLDANWTELVYKLRDKQYLFTVPALTNKYLGNNALPAGVEGVATDLKDHVKPKVFGQVYQMSPPLVNTSKLTYQVNDGAVSAISGVYDRGIPLTAGTNYATVALLLSSVPAAGRYNTCLAEGYFQLGATPDGQVTADVLQGATAALRTAAQVLQQIALASGLPLGEISSTDVAVLDGLNSAVVGVMSNSDSETFQSLMDEVATSVGAWYGFDTSGALRMGRLSTPSGIPTLYLDEARFSERIERRSAHDNNVPAWSVQVNYSKVYTTQTDLAAGVSNTLKAFLAQAIRAKKQEDAAVKLRHKLATPIVVDSLLTTETDAGTEAARLLALQSVRRDVFDVTIPVELLPATPLVFLDVVSLTVSRFGLASGKMFRLIGLNYQLAAGQITLTLWG